MSEHMSQASKAEDRYPLRSAFHALPRTKLAGTGLARAGRVLDNEALSRMVETSDEWIRTRSGIEERRVVDGESCCDLAAEAAARALADSGLSPADIGLILVATFTGDSLMPSLACRVQARLGIPNAVCFDLAAACSGFVYALTTADALLRSGLAEHALVVGAEVLSQTLDWTDRGSCVLFGDGAGAVVLSRRDEAEAGTSGLYGFAWGARGEDAADLDSLMLALSARAGAHMKMQGRQVYKFAVKVVPELVEACLAAADLRPEEIAWVVAHQANLRILESSALRCGIPLERWYHNLERYGNTSAASVPLALAEMAEQGLLKRGDKLILLGFGGGLTYGAILLSW